MRKIIAILLALLMSLSVLPATVFAANGEVKISYVVQPKSSKSNGKNPDTIYYFKNGVGNPNYTGIVNINGKQYYVQNGKVATDFSGKKKFEGKVYTIKDGVVVSVSTK